MSNDTITSIAQVDKNSLNLSSQPADSKSHLPEETYTPNVNMLRNEGYRIIHGSIFRKVRNELSAGVKAGHLMRLKKNGLMREVYCHPDKYDEAVSAQYEEFQRAINNIAKVFIP